jgi:hypothetical protein
MAAGRNLHALGAQADQVGPACSDRVRTSVRERETAQWAPVSAHMRAGREGAVGRAEAEVEWAEMAVAAQPSFLHIFLFLIFLFFSLLNLHFEFKFVCEIPT